MTYRAPLTQIRFLIEHVSYLSILLEANAYDGLDIETALDVLSENAKFCEQVLAPLQRVADKHPSDWCNGIVTTPPGYREAFKHFVDGGWQGVKHAVDFGGQALPKLLASCCSEIQNAADMAFALCPILTDGAVEALMIAGSQAQQTQFIPHLLSGRFCGTMNLTEPQAGSDLAQIRTIAHPQADGSYRLFGQKIFISYGEHDLAENIIHFVLARTPDAPSGVKGISLFIVPKILVHSDGSLGERNEVQCIGIEHKLGLHGSPTCTLQYGQNEGAVGFLVGELNRGLSYMFIMMNAARFAVGIQAVGISERACQQASEYARTRIQSRPVDGHTTEPVCIAKHPDVARMLLTMQANTFACRNLAYVVASFDDLASHHPDAALRDKYAKRYDFFVSMVKGFCTELAVETTNFNIQVHGGMGYVEETGAAQLMRDARVLTIYEGTTAIQANDFLSRKVLRDNALLMNQLLNEVAQTIASLKIINHEVMQQFAKRLHAAHQALSQMVEFMVQHQHEPNRIYAGSVEFLMCAGYTFAAWQLGRGLLAIADEMTQAGKNGATNPAVNMPTNATVYTSILQLTIFLVKKFYQKQSL